MRERAAIGKELVEISNLEVDVKRKADDAVPPDEEHLLGREVEVGRAKRDIGKNGVEVVDGKLQKLRFHVRADRHVVAAALAAKVEERLVGDGASIVEVRHARRVATDEERVETVPLADLDKRDGSAVLGGGNLGRRDGRGAAAGVGIGIGIGARVGDPIFATVFAVAQVGQVRRLRVGRVGIATVDVGIRAGARRRRRVWICAQIGVMATAVAAGARTPRGVCQRAAHVLAARELMRTGSAVVLATAVAMRTNGREITARVGIVHVAFVVFVFLGLHERPLQLHAHNGHVPRTTGHGLKLGARRNADGGLDLGLDLDLGLGFVLCLGVGLDLGLDGGRRRQERAGGGNVGGHARAAEVLVVAVVAHRGNAAGQGHHFALVGLVG